MFIECIVFSFLQIILKNSCLNFDPTVQYRTPLILWFKYCVRFIKARYRAYVWLTTLFTAVGVVRIKNVTETVTTITVPLVATLATAWLVDYVELVLLHFALININTRAKLVININTKGPKEYGTESTKLRVSQSLPRIARIPQSWRPDNSHTSVTKIYTEL